MFLDVNLLLLCVFNELAYRLLYSVCIISYKLAVLSQNNAVINDILFLYLPAEYGQNPTLFVSWEGEAVGTP